MQDVEILFKQNEISRFSGNVYGRINRDTDIRRVQRWGIVDAISQIAYRVSYLFEGQNNAVLLRRIDTTEQVDISDTGTERSIIQVGKIAT